jgi:hypothetical protein
MYLGASDAVDPLHVCAVVWAYAYGQRVRVHFL